MNSKLLEQGLQIALKQNSPTALILDSYAEYKSQAHWSFIVQKNKLMGYGKNRQGKTFYSNFGYSIQSKIHSEHDVYKKVKGLLNQRESFELINIRLNKRNHLRLSKPCVCCIRFLQFVGCNNVYFSTNESTFDRLRF